MNHAFQSSQLDKEKCGICKYNFLQHSALAECQACKNIGPVNPVKTILMCESCETKEITATLEANKPENVKARVDAVQNAFTVGNGNGNAKIAAISHEASRILHNEISVREDIFNAHTKSIHALDQELHSDPSINNPNYVLAETIMASIKNFQDVMFDGMALVVKAGNEQRAAITYLNQMANRLRVEEREKLKIEDLNYKPLPPKLAKVGINKIGRPAGSSNKSEKPTKKYKLKMSELHAAMKETGLPGHIIATLSMKGQSIEEIKKWHFANMAKMKLTKIPNPDNIPGIESALPMVTEPKVKPEIVDEEPYNMDDED